MSSSSGAASHYASEPAAIPGSRLPTQHVPEDNQRRQSMLRSFLLLEEPQSPTLSADETGSWSGLSSSPGRPYGAEYDNRRRPSPTPPRTGGTYELSSSPRRESLITNASGSASSTPQAKKNTRGSRLGQQMGMQRQPGAGPSAAGYASHRTSMAFSSSDDGSARDAHVDDNSGRGVGGSANAARRPPPLGPAFGLNEGGGGGGGDDSAGTSSSMPMSTTTRQQRRTSRLHYNKGGDPPSSSSSSSNTSRFEERDRAARLAQGSLGSGFTASYRRPESMVVASASAAGAGGSDVGESPTSGRASAQRELFLPAMKNGGAGSRSNSPTVPIKAPRRMTSAQRLRSAREDLQGSLAESSAQGAHHGGASSSVTRQSSGSGTEVTPPTSAARSSFSWTSPTSDGHRATSRSIPTSSHAHSSSTTSAAARADRPTGSLSDAEIVTMGAIDGQDPASLLPANGAALSSKNVLTIALAKAQNAVQHDSSNAVPEAIRAYSQAVRLLQEVMDRISPKAGSASSSRKSNREEERRRLRVIHDTYADRIRLLSMIYASDSNGATSESAATGADDSLAVDPSHSESEEQEALEPEATSPYPGIGAPTISVQQDQDAGDATPLAAAVEKERMRSDSEGSFRSIDSREAMRAARPSHELTAPSSGGAASSIYEDLPPLPSTPYFDASPTLSQKEREGEKTIDGLRTPLASRFPSSASPSARSPPMPSSDSGPTTRSSMTLPRIERQEAMALPAQPKSARPFGDGDEVLASGVVALSPETSSMWRSSSPLGTGSTRQRATTLSSMAAGKRRSQATDYGSAGSATLDAAGPAATASATSSSQQALPRKSIAGGTTSISADPMARQASKDSTFTTTTTTATTTTSGGGGNNSADQESISSVRKRAISQPGRRPIIPSSFQAPALPKFSRKMSIPSLSSAFGAGGEKQQQPQASSSLSPSAANNMQGQQQREQQQRGEQRPGPSGTAAYRFPSPAPSFTSGYHALLDSGTANSPAVVPGEYPWSSAASTSGVTPGGSAKPRTAPTTTTTMSAAPPSDLFPSGLASHHIHGTVSFNLNQPSRAPRRLLACLPSSLHPDPSSYDVAPTPSAQVVLRPFVTARSVRNSLATGAFLTRKLCVLPSSWHYAVAGAVRLASLEAKVRAIEAVCSGIDAVDKSGQPLLLLAGSGANNNGGSTQQQQGLAASQASHFAKQLEDFDLLCGEVQNALAKKINFIESTGEAAASAAAAAAAASSQSLLPSSNGSAGGGGGSGGTVGKKSAFQNKFFTRSYLVDRVHAAAGKAGGSAGSGSSSVNGGGSNGSAFAHGASASMSGSSSIISSAGGASGGDSSAMAFIDGVARLLGKCQVLEAHLEACLAPLAPKAAAAATSPANGNGDATGDAAHKDITASHLPVTMYNATRRGSASDSTIPTSATPSTALSTSPTDPSTAGPPIPLLPQELRRLIEAKLRRSSDFLANVVLRFVLRDLAALVDKAVKRSAGGGGLVEG